MQPRTLSRTAALLLASSLALAACGDSGQSDAERAATGATLATTATTAPATTDEPVEPSIVTDETTTTTATGDDAADTTEAAPVEAEPEPHLFPDVDVLDIYNGGEVNLGEALSGGDKAVLLWFFAPH